MASRGAAPSWKLKTILCPPAFQQYLVQLNRDCESADTFGMKRLGCAGYLALGTTIVTVAFWLFVRTLKWEPQAGFDIIGFLWLWHPGWCFLPGGRS